MSGDAFTYEKLLGMWRSLQEPIPEPPPRPRFMIEQPLLSSRFHPLGELTPGPGSPLDGLPVHLDSNLPQWETERVQWRFPRSRRRRIRRKWASEPLNWRTQIKQPRERLVYKVLGVLWMHPETWEAIKRKLAPR